MPNILVIDDEITMRSLFNYVFTEAGYTVKTATDGIDALAKLDSFTPI